MVTLFQQLNLLLNSSDRKRLVFLACALVLRAGVEMVGVASIMPFIGVVANPEIIYQNDYLRLFYSLFEFDSSRHFVIALGCVVIIFLVLANGISALTVYATTRFSWGVHHRLSIRLLEGYLRQPFAFFVQHNSAEFNKILLNECQQVIQNLLLPLLNAIAKSLVITAIAIMLFIMEPTLALSVVLVVGGVYAVLFAALKKKQRQLGKDRVKANEERFKITGEVFGGIKDVKVLQREYSFVTKFRSASRRFSLATASNATIAALPRYLFETIIMTP